MASNKKPKATPTPAAATVEPGGVTKFQKFETATIRRSQIAGAPYNPRRITAKAKLKLRETLEKVGLVQPVVWNKRSGTLVGGHQRLEQIDALEGGRDYELTVAVIDVDERREKELNVLLNNPEVSGDWDLTKLQELVNGDIDLGNTGFDLGDVMQLFGEAPAQKEGQQYQELAGQLEKIHEQYDKLAKSAVDKDDADYYLVVVFRGHDERKAFTDALELGDNRYLDGRILAALLGQGRGKVEQPQQPAKGNGAGEAARVGEHESVGAKEKP